MSVQWVNRRVCRLENGKSWEEIWNLAKKKAGYPELNPAIGTEKTAAIQLCKE